VGISGSLRHGSYNTALLRAAREVVSAGTNLQIASIREIPLYDGDVETATGIPPAVGALKDRIAASDGLLIATPEYNNGIPGVLKNALDWLTRPAADIARVFRDRPVAIMGATPGRNGTILAQAAWLPILRTLGTRPFFGGRLTVSGAKDAFDEEGRLVDEQIRGQLGRFMAGFEAFITKGS
jgi:NAD(P)H-dependent FMN reductase